MKVEHYIKKLKKSKEFNDFTKDDPQSYLCSVFLVRDFIGNHNETQLDFYSPKIKKIISFKVDRGVTKIPIDKRAETITHKKFVPKKLDEKINLDVDVLKPTILDDMHNRGLTGEIQKILVILHELDDRNVWNCTCFLGGLGLLQCHIEDSSGTVLFMEKKSFFDLIKFTGAPPGLPPIKGLGGETGVDEQGEDLGINLGEPKGKKGK